MMPYMTEDDIVRFYNEMSPNQNRVKIISELIDTDEAYVKVVVGLQDEVIETCKPKHYKGKGVDYEKMGKLLKKKGLTLQDIALFCGCSKSLVSAFLKKNRKEYPERVVRVIKKRSNYEL